MKRIKVEEEQLMIKISKYAGEIYLKHNRIQIPRVSGIVGGFVDEYLQEDGSILILPVGKSFPREYSSSFKLNAKPYAVQPVLNTITISSLSGYKGGDRVEFWKDQRGYILLKRAENEN